MGTFLGPRRRSPFAFERLCRAAQLADGCRRRRCRPRPSAAASGLDLVRRRRCIGAGPRSWVNRPPEDQCGGCRQVSRDMKPSRRRGAASVPHVRTGRASGARGGRGPCPTRLQKPSSHPVILPRPRECPGRSAAARRPWRRRCACADTAAQTPSTAEISSSTSTVPIVDQHRVAGEAPSPIGGGGDVHVLRRGQGRHHHHLYRAALRSPSSSATPSAITGISSSFEAEATAISPR